MLSFGRLRQQIAPEGVPHVHYDSFSSFNQSDTSIYDITEHTKAPKTGHAWNIVCINLLSAEALQFIMKQWCSVPMDISKSTLMSVRLPP